MKKLIYYSINKNYLDLFLISFKSLLNNVDFETTDVLLITDKQTKCDSSIVGLPLLFHIISIDNPFDSACGRFKIYEFDKIMNYDKVLYLDADIVIIKNIDIVFNYMTEKEIYTNQGYLSDLSHSNYTFNLTKEEKEKINSENRYGINSGVFGFHIDKLCFFENLSIFIANNKNLNLPLYEQPFFGTFLLRNNPYYLNIGNPLNSSTCDVLINNDVMSNFNNVESVVILHFAGDIGNKNSKKNKMNKYV